MENLIDQAVEYNDGIGIEMAVLALCMRRDTAVIEVVQNKITSEDFSDDRNSIIYGVISEMFYEGTDIDRFTVFAELERRGIADKVGGQSYIYRVGDTTAVQSAMTSYILALKDRSDRRKILKVLDKIRTQTLGSKMRTPLILDSAINEFSQLKREGEMTGLVAIADALKTTLTEIHTEIRDGDTGKVKLGYPKLDAMLGGLGPGTLHILGARPGMGKSALAINMAINVAAKDKMVVIFSLEMSNSEICKRMMSAAMTKPINDIIYSRQLTDSDKQQMDQALIKLRDFPIYLDDSADINPATIKSRIQQLSAAGKPPKLVFVDYLQLINMKGLPGRSRNDEVANISRASSLWPRSLRSRSLRSRSCPETPRRGPTTHRRLPTSVTRVPSSRMLIPSCSLTGPITSMTRVEVPIRDLCRPQISSAISVLSRPISTWRRTVTAGPARIPSGGSRARRCSMRMPMPILLSRTVHTAEL